MSTTPPSSGEPGDSTYHRASARLLETIRQLDEKIGDADDLETALHHTLAEVGNYTDRISAEGWMRQPGDDIRLTLRATWSADASEPPRHAALPETIDADNGLVGRAFQSGEFVWEADPEDPTPRTVPRADGQPDHGSALAVPISGDEGPRGVLVWNASPPVARRDEVVELARVAATKLATYLQSSDLERALERERRRFQQMAENIGGVFWLTSPDKSEMLYVSPAYETIWGRSRESLYDDPLTWLDPIHPDDRDRVREALERQKTDGEYCEEYRIRRPDDEIRWIRDRAYAIREDGEVVRIVGIAHDITDHKRIEQKLRTSEEKFSTAFQVNPLSMTIITLEEGRFLEVNDGFVEISGYAPERVLGRRAAEFDFWVEPEARREVEARLEAGETVRNFETQFRRADGDIQDVLYSAERLEFDGTECVLTATQDITPRKRYEQELEFRALHDSLTGLPNRSLFRQHLEDALERHEETDRELAVIFLDLDRFKVVNDTLGHPAGDQLLREVATRLQRVVDDETVVARFGGDEFVLLLEPVDDHREPRRVANRLVQALAEPCIVADTEVHPTASVGIALSDGDCRDIDDLLRYADVAMFESKSAESTQIGLYHLTDDLCVTERLHHENELREAIADEQFVVYYQPVVDLQTDQLIGLEALARWNHPDEGILPPTSFISTAEETGLIVPLGYQIIEQAAETFADWFANHPTLGSEQTVRLAVNLSGRQYRADDLVAEIRQIAERTGFDLGSLVLEITESILMNGSGKLQELRHDGVGVAIDDFGTGYSSLQYLRELEADGLKIDRSFVEGLDGDGRESVLVEAILTMGQKFGMNVIAEGIETAEQQRILRELGARLGQGFHFAGPMPADQFADTYL
jgi:diguanylate cyclase (GGDEF)-like protein/PAS domain S-box-containing protein